MGEGSTKGTDAYDDKKLSDSNLQTSQRAGSEDRDSIVEEPKSEAKWEVYGLPGS